MRRLTITVILLLAFAFTAQAESTDTLTDEIYSTVPDEYSSVLDSVRDGHLTDFGGIVGEILSAVTDDVFSLVTSVGTVTATLMLSVVYRTVADTLAEPVKPALTVLSSAVISATLVTATEPLTDVFRECIERLCSYMTVLTPTVTAISLLGGNVTASGVFAGGLMLTISLIANVLGTFGTAMLRVSFALAVVSFMTSRPILPLLSVAKKALAWGVGLVLGIFALVMGLQTSLASNADMASARTVRFAVARIVPIVGGAVADAVSTVSSGISLIKSTCGTVAVVVIFLTFLPTLIRFFAVRAVFSLLSFGAELFGLASEKQVLDELGSAVAYMIALITMTAVMFIYVMTLFVTVASPLGGVS